MRFVYTIFEYVYMCYYGQENRVKMGGPCEPHTSVSYITSVTIISTIEDFKNVYHNTIQYWKKKKKKF